LKGIGSERTQKLYFLLVKIIYAVMTTKVAYFLKSLKETKENVQKGPRQQAAAPAVADEASMLMLRRGEKREIEQGWKMTGQSS